MRRFDNPLTSVSTEPDIQANQNVVAATSSMFTESASRLTHANAVGPSLVIAEQVDSETLTQPPPWNEHLTPLSFFERAAWAFRDKTAVVYGDQRYTYGEFATRVHRLASALRGAGLNQGDRVAVLCPNIPPMLEAHFAVPLAGGVIVAINIRLAADEVGWILEHSGARFLLVDTEFSPLIAPAIDRLPKLHQIVNVVDTGPAPTLPGPTYEEFLATGHAGSPGLATRE